MHQPCRLRWAHRSRRGYQPDRLDSGDATCRDAHCAS